MNFFSAIGWILWKDLLSELRSRENFSSMLFFALAVILIFSFSFSTDQEAVRELIGPVADQPGQRDGKLPGGHGDELLWSAGNFTSLSEFGTGSGHYRRTGLVLHYLSRL